MCPTDSDGTPAGPDRDRSPGERPAPPSHPDSSPDAGPESGGPPGRRDRDELEGVVSGKAARKLRARREGDRGIWFGLGMMGLVGWSVAVPTVVGIAVGVWLDRRDPGSGSVSWTLTFLVVGVAIGCINAWFWIQRELEGRD